MVTTLYLIRHGETEGSDTKRYHGSIDVPLSEKGVEQMKGTSAFLSEHLKTSASSQYSSYLLDLTKPKAEMREHGYAGSSGIADAGPSRLTAVYCSDLGRAVRSAEIIAGPHGLKAAVIPALRERSFGIWEGMSFLEIKEKYPVEFESWAGNPVEFSPMEGESTSGLQKRVIP
ncbi:MAG TPA: histidine phosphatase family protein, partial [Thermodesulfovibrionales bacterium]|nr:histidine phosphatase family protein [Thermodesulfovibrionales bacterium]